MANQTTTTERLDRDTAANRLEAIAAALRSGDDCTVRVGNKDISLSPPNAVDFRIDVVERQRRFRGNRETIKVELDWKPE